MKHEIANTIVPLTNVGTNVGISSIGLYVPEPQLPISNNLLFETVQSGNLVSS